MEDKDVTKLLPCIPLTLFYSTPINSHRKYDDVHPSVLMVGENHKHSFSYFARRGKKKIHLHSLK